ncbi:MAG: RecQ family ATP-dependent DNA helicase [Bacteroidales bacterium]|nr:RecQ family ATP-dependent DNA helicase [Bacteroidales bacterium]
MDIKQLLIQYWGYSNFRPKQEEIIQNVLDGKDTLALLPTGGGKSMTYQIPALKMDGLCLVITPLIALMKDQIRSLKKRKIEAVVIYSGMNAHQIDVAWNQCTHGDAKFLYLSPERLASPHFINRIPQLKINLIAVDEAHCISQWGYDFRPSYLNISNLRTYLPNVPILALTATATFDVVQDIQEKLQFRKQNVIRESFNRSNLVYFVSFEENKMGTLLRMINKQKGSGIVYVRSRRKTAEIATFLVKNSISATHYHAGLNSSERDRRQADWMQGEIRIMVATNAFGMGIDKPNVRFVVHMDLPDNLESYFQEAGRAGRDQQKAFAVLLWEKADISDLKKNFELSYPPIEAIKNTYQALGNYYRLAVGSGKGEQFDFDLSDFSRNYNFQPKVTYNALKFLERQAYITLNEGIHSPTKIQFRLNGNDLYKFQVANGRYDIFIKFLLRTYSGLFDSPVRISLLQIAKAFKSEAKQIHLILESLHKLEVINYYPEKTKPQITYLTERLPLSDLRISPEIYKNRRAVAKNRVKTVIDYTTTTNKCRNQLLLAYFGEDIGTRCGKCDVCLRRNNAALSELEFDNAVEIIKPILSVRNLTLDELIFETSGEDIENLLAAVSWLRDNNKIREDSQHRLYWNQAKD